MSELLVSVRGGVATVTLNRPAALNALSMGMLEGLHDLLDRFELGSVQRAFDRDMRLFEIDRL